MRHYHLQTALFVAFAAAFVGMMGYLVWTAWETSKLTAGVVVDMRHSPAHSESHVEYVYVDGKSHPVVHHDWVPDRWTVTIQGPHPEKPEKTLRRRLEVSQSVYGGVRLGEWFEVGSWKSGPVTAEKE
jgi:hypothetical protein